jgi:hypothetical protein
MRSVPAFRMRGASRLELAVVVVLIAILLGSFLHMVRYYQEQAEKMSVELTIVNIKTGLLQEIAGRLTQHEGRDARSLVGANPVQWLSGPPPGYLGEFKDVDQSLVQPGSWYFDIGSGELVYKLNLSNNFKLERAATMRPEIRWRVGSRAAFPGGEVPVEALALLETVEYRWF